MVKQVETRFDTSNYELINYYLEKSKNVIGLVKDELDGKIMTDFVALKFETFSYLIDDGDKKTKGTKKCVMKQNLKFEN